MRRNILAIVEHGIKCFCVSHISGLHRIGFYSLGGHYNDLLARPHYNLKRYKNYTCFTPTAAPPPRQSPARLSGRGFRYRTG